MYDFILVLMILMDSRMNFKVSYDFKCIVLSSTYTHTHIHTHMHRYTDTHKHTHAHTHAYTHTHTHTCTHKHTQTHTHTHTHTYHESSLRSAVRFPHNKADLGCGGLGQHSSKVVSHFAFHSVTKKLFRAETIIGTA